MVVNAASPPSWEIQRGVTIGDRCKVEGVRLYPSGVTIEDEVFVGPNDLHQRPASQSGGGLSITTTVVKRGVDRRGSGHRLRGHHRGGATVGAGAVVTKDVPAGAIVVGNQPDRSGKVILDRINSQRSLIRSVIHSHAGQDRGRGRTRICWSAIGLFVRLYGT